MAVEEDLTSWDTASTKKMYSYGVGYVIINYFLYGGFALVFYFYEVELGLSAIYIMVAFVIFAIWNMVNDPLLGFLTEKPFKWTRKYGFRAPWVAITAFPILIFYLLIWTPPAGASQEMLLIWFVLITCLFDTFFSVFNDHVYGGYTNQFPSEFERRRSFARTSLLLGFGVTGLGIFVSLLIVYGDPASFVRAAIFVIVIMAVLNVILLLGVRESEQMKEMFINSFEKLKGENKFFPIMKTALKTKNFTVSLIGYTAQITAMTFIGFSTIFMYQYIYGLPLSAYILPAIAGLITFLALIPFWSNYSKKHGFKKQYWICFILHGISYLPLLIIGPAMGPIFYILLIIMGAVTGVFYSGEVLMLMPVASDTYDLVSSNVGRRVDATLVGVRTFFFRVSFLVVGILIPLIHITTGFIPTTNPYVTQPTLAKIGILIHAVLIPAIILIIAGIFFKKFYTLEGAEKEALIAKLKEMEIYR